MSNFLRQGQQRLYTVILGDGRATRLCAAPPPSILQPPALKKA
jgi:hypothetical protein